MTLEYNNDVLPVRRSTTAQAIAVGGPINPDTWTMFANIAEQLCDTEFVSRELRGKKPAVLAAMLYGNDLGLPPMVSLREVTMVDGKPSLSAGIITAIVRSRGHSLTREEHRNGDGSIQAVTAIGKRRDSGNEDSFTFSMEMAHRASLVRVGSGWTKYPEAMLWARAVTQLARQLFPDVFLGAVYTPDELGGPDIVEGSASPPEVEHPEPSGASGEEGDEGDAGPAAAAVEPAPPPSPLIAALTLGDRARDMLHAKLDPNIADLSIAQFQDIGIKAAKEKARATEDVDWLRLWGDAEARRGKPRKTVLLAIHKQIEKVQNSGGKDVGASGEDEHTASKAAVTAPSPAAGANGQEDPWLSLERVRAFLGLVWEQPEQFIGTEHEADQWTPDHVKKGIAKKFDKEHLADLEDDELDLIWQSVPARIRDTVDAMDAEQRSYFAAKGEA